MSALADFGSGLGIIPADFTQQNSLPLDSSERVSVRLPTKTIRSRSTITLPFVFNGETSLFDRKFHVVSSRTYDMILNYGFLEVTETSTKFQSRLQAKFTPRPYGPRMRLIGSPKHQILGTISGKPVADFPDTGSDMMLMSWRRAQKLRLHVHTKLKYKICLEFANGFRAFMYSMAHSVEW